MPGIPVGLEPPVTSVLTLYVSRDAHLGLKFTATHTGTSRSRVPHGSIASTTLFSISTST